MQFINLCVTSNVLHGIHCYAIRRIAGFDYLKGAKIIQTNHVGEANVANNFKNTSVPERIKKSNSTKQRDTIFKRSIIDMELRKEFDNCKLHVLGCLVYICSWSVLECFRCTH